MIDSILIFSRSTPHHCTGGMETLAWSLAAEWARSVGEVQIVTTEIPGSHGPFVEDGVKVVPLNNTRPGRYSHAWWQESRRYWHSRDDAPRVVFSVSAGAYSVVRQRSRHPGTPFVLQAHGTSAMELWSKFHAHDARSVATAPKNALSLCRDLVRYREFDRVVAVGENVFDSLVARPQRWSVGPDKVRLIRNGVRAESYRFDAGARREIREFLGVPDDVTVVGCVGRLHIQKRVDRVLRAAAVLRDRGQGDRFRFLLVGDGPDEVRLRGLVRELRLEGLVAFAGRVDPGGVRWYHSAADVSVLTTAHREAGLPLAVIEALACGLPCVVPSAVFGSAAFGLALHKVDVANPAVLADALFDVTQRRPMRESLLPFDFTLEQCAKKYLAEFEQLASVTGSRG